VSTAAVTLVSLVAALGLANLLLCVGLARRLREHGAVLARWAENEHRSAMGVQMLELSGLPAGSPAPGFRAVTVDGTELRSEPLAEGEHIVAFFSAECDSCREQVGPFLRFVEPYGSDRVLGIVTGDPAAGADIVAELDGRATVVSEEALGPVSMAFRVQAFPSFFVVRDGVVVANAPTVRGLFSATLTAT
jgi:hypothetical protein